MKNLLAVLLVTTLGVMAEAQQTPPWINEMPPDGVLWGIGVAKQSNQGLSKTMAENRARQSISLQLESAVKAMLTDYNRDAGTGGKPVSVSFQESISRTVSGSQLTGSKVLNVWVAPDGNFWSRVEYRKEAAKRWIRGLLKDKGTETFDDERIAYSVDTIIDVSRDVTVTR
jgi:hypothetical protein